MGALQIRARQVLPHTAIQSNFRINFDHAVAQLWLLV